jgi:predicted phage tail protein
LVSAVEKMAQHTKAMTPEQLESYGLVEYEKLQKVYGEGLEEKLQSAAVMIHALDQKMPGLKNLLRAKGIGDNALVVAQIIGQAERWQARRKGR